MNGVKSWWRRLLGLMHRSSHETQMNEEIRQHLDGLLARNLAAGMQPEEARQAALRQFGGVEQVKENARAERIWICRRSFGRTSDTACGCW